MAVILPGKGGGRATPLPMDIPTLQPFSPVDSVRSGAARYAASRGVVLNDSGLDNLRVDPHRGIETFRQYHTGMQGPISPSTMASYRSMVGEIGSQFDHLTRPASRGGIGIDVEVTHEDPYPSSAAMAEDMRNNNRLRVFSTASTGGHSFFTDDQNDMFRAIHDAYGHAAIGRGFDRHGEEAAYLHHRQMFSPQSREALTSETRGQNMYLNFNNLGHSFPDNAIVGMPAWTQGTGRFRGSPEALHREQQIRRINALNRRRQLGIPGM